MIVRTCITWLMFCDIAVYASFNITPSRDGKKKEKLKYSKDEHLKKYPPGAHTYLQGQQGGSSSTQQPPPRSPGTPALRPPSRNTDSVSAYTDYSGTPSNPPAHISRQLTPSPRFNYQQQPMPRRDSSSFSNSSASTSGAMQQLALLQQLGSRQEVDTNLARRLEERKFKMQERNAPRSSTPAYNPSSQTGNQFHHQPASRSSDRDAMEIDPQTAEVDFQPRSLLRLAEVDFDGHTSRSRMRSIIRLAELDFNQLRLKYPPKLKYNAFGRQREDSIAGLTTGIQNLSTEPVQWCQLCSRQIRISQWQHHLNKYHSQALAAHEALQLEGLRRSAPSRSSSRSDRNSGGHIPLPPDYLGRG